MEERQTGHGQSGAIVINEEGAKGPVREGGAREYEVKGSVTASAKAGRPTAELCNCT